MKICFVDYDITVVGGAEQVSVSLANEFCRDYDVYIYSINHVNETVPYEINKNVAVLWGPEGKNRLNEMIRGNFSPFLSFIKKQKIDIIMMMGNYPALIVSMTRFFTKAKYVFCDHGALINQWKQKDITLIRLWDAIISHCVVVLTERTRSDYIRKFYLKEKKVKCIYNWNDVPLLKEAYQTNSKKIISVGRIDKEKGYDMVPYIAEMIFKKHPNWEWDIYGDGEMFSELKEKLKINNLLDKVHLKGMHKNVRNLYKEYSFLILPSYREGLPLVLLEAKANRLPVISFDIPTGPKEIVQDGIDGFLIEPYDMEKMAEKAQSLIENDLLRRSFSDASQKNMNKFSKDEIRRLWVELFSNLQCKG